MVIPVMCERVGGPREIPLPSRKINAVVSEMEVFAVSFALQEMEVRAIQRQSSWCAGLACLSRSSAYTYETDRRNQMDQLLATRRGMVP